MIFDNDGYDCSAIDDNDAKMTKPFWGVYNLLVSFEALILSSNLRAMKVAFVAQRKNRPCWVTSPGIAS